MKDALDLKKLNDTKMAASAREINKARTQLLDWYHKNKRDLPWRSSRDPYRIWISEVMLQQTTVTAVRPFYDKFMTRFPTLNSLAEATIEDVYQHWAGLGYYSRARNLHKAAKLLWSKVQSGEGFPRTAAELIELPGFGPYTSRAVASLAFGERVGVLDGNVIRILSRFFGLDLDWWLPKNRETLQKISDLLADCYNNHDLNQAMMELGATVCTTKKPLCVSCPWMKNCRSFADGKVISRPRAKPRPEKEIWVWDFKIIEKKNAILLTENSATPFLKGLKFPPSRAQKVRTKPKDYHFTHSVTKYALFIRLEKIEETPTKPVALKSLEQAKWTRKNEISAVNPTSLMAKLLKHSEKISNKRN